MEKTTYNKIRRKIMYYITLDDKYKSYNGRIRGMNAYYKIK